MLRNYVTQNLVAKKSAKFCGRIERNLYVFQVSIEFIIHKAGGLAFLAHPYEYRFEDTLGFIDKLKKYKCNVSAKFVTINLRSKPQPLWLIRHLKHYNGWLMRCKNYDSYPLP